MKIQKRKKYNFYCCWYNGCAIKWNDIPFSFGYKYICFSNFNIWWHYSITQYIRAFSIFTSPYFFLFFCFYLPLFLNIYTNKQKLQIFLFFNQIFFLSFLFHFVKKLKCRYIFKDSGLVDAFAFFMNSYIHIEFTHRYMHI